MSRKANESSPSISSSIWAWLAGVFSALLAVHFGVAGCFWMKALAHDRARFAPSSVLAVYWPDWFVPLLLLSLSVACLILSIARSRATKRVLILTVLAAVTFFSVDVSLGRYQFSVGIATKSYWDSGGPEHVYYTWWWFNDRWFRASYWEARSAG